MSLDLPLGVLKVASIYETSAGLKCLPLSVVQQFNFTDAESFVCLGLVQGKSLDDLADESRQSRVILRQQFQSILIKTGTDTEAKLVTKVLSGGLSLKGVS
jgi:hypothetical protein